MQYITNSEKETKKLAEKLAKNPSSNIIALTGELGAGKTIFAQGFAKGLGIKEKIISPTFVLVRQHKIPKMKKIFYHIDLYRIEQFESLGLKEIMADQSNIVLIEWAEKLKDLPKNAIKILIQKQDSSKRVITLS